MQAIKSCSGQLLNIVRYFIIEGLRELGKHNLVFIENFFRLLHHLVEPLHALTFYWA